MKKTNRATRKATLAKITLAGSLLAAPLVALGLTTPQAAMAQVSDNVIRIAVMNDQSSAYSDTSGRGSAVAAELAVQDAGGKVNGAPVELLVVDHQNKADIGATQAKKLIDVDRVDALFDMANSSVSLAVQEITRQAGKVVVHVGSAHVDLYGKACSPTGALWLYDSHALAKGLAHAIYGPESKNWFMIVADYAFGHAMQQDMTKTLEALGGKVSGAVRHPLGQADFSSFLLQSAGSNTNVLALLNAGTDTTNALKQAGEFGVTGKGMVVATPIFTIVNAKAIGPQLAQGTQFLAGYYWDADDASRAFAKRFAEKMKRPPTHTQAGVYSAVNHYLKAIAAAKTDDGPQVMRKMKELPVNDFMTKNASLREDGRLMRDMLLLQVKKPADVKGEWDLAEVRGVAKAGDTIRPLSEGGCALVKS